MIFPQLAQFTDIALLLLRLMVGIVLTGNAEQGHWDEQELHNFSGCS